MKTKFFTLIELLAVIMIIAILSAMLFGGSALVQKITKRTACSNNLRDIMMAMKVYSSNTSQQLFPGPTPWGEKEKNVTIEDILIKSNNPTLTDKQLRRDSYLEEDELSLKGWFCPADPNGMFSADASEKYRTSYIFNASFRASPAVSSIAESDIVAPARTIAWMDAHYGPDVLLGGGKKNVIRKYDDFKKMLEFWNEQKYGIHGKVKNIDANVIMYDGSLERFGEARFDKENRKKTFEKFMFIDGK